MLLGFSSDHKQDLAFLQSLSPDVARDFACLAAEFLIKGTKPKLYQGAANKLGIGVDIIRRGVQGLMQLLAESTKLSLSDMDFSDSVSSLGLQTESTAQLLQVYEDHRLVLRHMLSVSAPHHLYYCRFEWRLDVNVASRCFAHQLDPVLLFQLTLEKEGEKEPLVLQTDPLNLINLATALEQALYELKAQHCRRITRLMK